ncbi:hypothetical protein SPBR_07362 [Sporothrix brasiliensis 5110]|uniref:Uncharacterized protein n=1 Tax=Sporothrix brasiliensis 5110 TaxID=1398154 RepID=A0A0C2ITS9_9PEZI|nr:uncharacterized protein SPBR_07362 [Sporothrix brasiliensis 5110]KIH88427.1 hypothetical protein SPBR_07362 [Sporothrix brasiliensis 5110]
MDPRLDSMPTVRRWHHLFRYPCMTDELMDATTSPRVTIKNLAQPRLRRCPLNIDTIDWRRARLLGAGTDGCVYRVHFGDQGPFALKLFWIPDILLEYPEYSAVHRECQNAALLQMLRASVDQAAAAAEAGITGGTPNGPTVPPLVDPNPVDFFTASNNLFSFSEEVRHNHQVRAAENKPPPSGLVPVMSMPRFVQCYGWLPCNVHELMKKMPRRIRSYGFHVDRKTYRCFDEARTDFIGIVYEYIHSNDNDNSDDSDGSQSEEQWRQTTISPTTAPSEKVTAPVARRHNTRSSTRQTGHGAAPAAEEHVSGPDEVAHARQAAEAARDAKHRERVSAVADFLWLAGFDFCCQPLARNWKNGVLLDHSEIIGAYSAYWDRCSKNTKWLLDWLLTPSDGRLC